MFGYVMVNKPEMKIKDYSRYRAYYCGLCHTLKDKYGFLGQMTLTYDMTFLIVLLTSLYEPETASNHKRCIAHPVKTQPLLVNELSIYAADMNLALAYHNFIDDWEDEKKIVGLASAHAIKSKYKEVEQRYPRQCSEIKAALQQLQEYEKVNESSLDLVSGCFGRLMAELLVYRQDIWENTLRSIGFYLGKFIYLMDAYFDVEKDIKQRNYNPLIHYQGRDDYEQFCDEMLTMMISETANEFEKLPCIAEADILKNILYCGVWNKYNRSKQKKREEIPS